jgi:hypothetical protein
MKNRALARQLAQEEAGPRVQVRRQLHEDSVRESEGRQELKSTPGAQRIRSIVLSVGGWSGGTSGPPSAIDGS